MWTAERWVAYYTDDRVYRSEDWPWQALPSTGVLVVVLINPTGRTVLAGGDWYFKNDGKYGYVASVEWGQHEPPPDIPCQSCVKEGVGAEDDVFNAVYAQAINRPN